MRRGVAGGDNSARVPRAHLGRRQKLFVGSQLFGAAAVEEPGRLVAAGADGSLDRAQDGQRKTLGTIEQVMARHVALLCALSTAGLSHHARAARGGYCYPVDQPVAQPCRRTPDAPATPQPPPDASRTPHSACNTNTKSTRLN